MNIGEVAKRANLNTSTLRYYESIGLLPDVERQNGRRVYTDEIFPRLQLIKVSKQSGWSLDEIKSLFDAETESGHIAMQWRTKAKQKLIELDTLIAQAEAMKAVIHRGLACNCSGKDDCDLFAT